MKLLPLVAAGVLVFTIFSSQAASAPSVTTTNPSSITTNSATLNGSVNPNGLTTMAYFQWGTTTNYGSVTTAQSLGAGSAPILVQANLPSLLTDTSYHYRLVASNASGITAGNDAIVTPTLLLYLYAGETWSYVFHDLPLAGTTYNPADPFIVSSFGILSNSFPAGGSVRFELFANSTNGSPLNSIVVNSPAASGFASSVGPLDSWDDHQGAVRLTVLTGSVVVTSLYFQEVGQHGVGGFAPLYQNTITPTKIPQPPAFGTQFVSSVSIQSAVITADINVKNLASVAFIQWGPTTNYGFASGATPLDFDYFVRKDVTASNLASGTFYHLRVVTTNSAGATYGNDLTLTTLAPATVITQPASNRKTTSVALNATASINGLASTAYFEWGATTNYDQVTPLQSLGSSTATTNISASISGLSPQTTYHARALVFSAGVTNRGTDVAFSTTPPPTNLVVTNLVSDDVRGAIERGGTVRFACNGVLALSNQIDIANDVCLDGSGQSIVFSGSNITRIFKVQPGTLLTLTNITLANNEGVLTAQDCKFLNNSVLGVSGINGTNGLPGTNNANLQLVTPGRPGGPGGKGQDVSGGAIYNSGSAALIGCLFAGNQATGGDGGQGGDGGIGGAQLPCCSTGGKDGGTGGAGGVGGFSVGASIANFGILFANACSFSNSLVTGGQGGGGGAGGYAGGGPVSHTGVGGPAVTWVPTPVMAAFHQAVRWRWEAATVSS